LLLSSLASPALSQEWRGITVRRTQIGAAGTFTTGNSTKTYGVGGFTRVSRLTLGASYDLTRFDNGGGSRNTIGFDGALRMRIPELREVRVSVAPVAALRYSFDNQAKAIEIPVGVAVAYRVRLAEDLKVAPYVVPQIALNRISYDFQGAESQTNTDFGFTVGGNVRISDYYVGGFYRKIGSGDGRLGVNVVWLTPGPERVRETVESVVR
jgi:hypothetical protein